MYEYTTGTSTSRFFLLCTFLSFKKEKYPRHGDTATQRPARRPAEGQAEQGRARRTRIRPAETSRRTLRLEKAHGVDQPDDGSKKRSLRGLSRGATPHEPGPGTRHSAQPDVQPAVENQSLEQDGQPDAVKNKRALASVDRTGTGNTTLRTGASQTIEKVGIGTGTLYATQK